MQSGCHTVLEWTMCVDDALSSWQDVCRSLGLDLSGQTSASYNMRLNYERCLLDFENYLGSGQYAGDLAAGAAPHFATITEPQRNFGHLPPPDMGLEGEGGGGAVPGHTVRCGAVSA